MKEKQTPQVLTEQKERRFNQMLFWLADQDFLSWFLTEGKEENAAFFDVGLYNRMKKRMERMIYGQEKPAIREIPAAEALAKEIRSALRRKKGKRLYDPGSR